MRTDSFDFDLPPELIAQHPIEPRDKARLLHVGQSLGDRSVQDLPDLLEPGDVMVVNDTKVIPARLFGKRGAARIEVTLHRHVSAGRWNAFVRPARRLKAGDEIVFAPGLAAHVDEKLAGGEICLNFACDDSSLLAALERHGQMPLPPYIKRREGGEESDHRDYQTVFAAAPGAVAAPTAALHFTPSLLSRLEARGIERVAVTLHVGAGTFLPVKSEDPCEHKMHSEFGLVSASAAERINRARADGRRILAVGTTALRLLETAANDAHEIRPFAGETSLFILPGYQFRVIDLLMTNFHLPRSTLFMLVCAFAGTERMKAAYGHAIKAGYRFFSYGDACLLEPESSEV